MRIGIDYTSAASQRGGIGRYTRGLVQALVELDAQNRYLLLVAGRGKGLGQEPWPSHVQFRRIPISDRWTTILWQRLRLPIPVQIATGKLDLFHSPDFVLPPVLSTPALLTVHDLSFLRLPECFVPSFSRYLHQAVSRAVRRSARILADSHSTRTDLVELLGVDEKRITVLYPGVDACFRPIADAEYLGRIRDDYGLPKRFVLGVGTLQPRKNFAGLIDAYGHACRMAPGDTADLDLVIAGAKGWMYDDILAAAAQKDIAGRVRLLGFVPDRDLPALYNLAWVFAFPSLYEGFGLPILEAMACGVPVAAANNSSLPEAAGEGALLVDARDHEALADALLRLCVDTNLRASLVAAGHRQVQRFGWVRAAEQLRDVYSEEAGRRRREGFA